jgi:hypothetical protein
VTAQPEEETPVFDGPDPRTWPGKDDIWRHAEDVRVADEVLDLLSGKVAQDGMSRAYEEARALVRHLASVSRENLAAALLDAYEVEVPEENPGLPTEAVGGSRGDGDSPGNRDHVRGVRQ